MSNEPNSQEQPEKNDTGASAPEPKPQEGVPGTSGQPGGFNEFGIPLDESGKVVAPAPAGQENVPPGQEGGASSATGSEEKAGAEEGPRRILDELDKASSGKEESGEERADVPSTTSAENPPAQESPEYEALMTDAMRRLDEMLTKLRRRRDSA